MSITTATMPQFWAPPGARGDAIRRAHEAGTACTVVVARINEAYRGPRGSFEIEFCSEGEEERGGGFMRALDRSGELFAVRTLIHEGQLCLGITFVSDEVAARSIAASGIIFLPS